MLKLYNFEISGNCYKIRLMLSFLELPCEIIPVNLKVGEHKTPKFMEMNPFGMVPILVDGEIIIRDSQAILIYLAQKYDRDKWFSDEPETMSKISQWLFTSTHDIQMGLAAARVYYLLGRKLDIDLATQRAHSLLKTMDTYLTDKNWLESDRPTIADVACFPYIALAHDAKIDLAEYPHTLAWVERFKQLPNFIPLPTVVVKP